MNKIVRTEYDEPLYTELALEALKAWRAPEWAGIFHETVRCKDLNPHAACDGVKLIPIILGTIDGYIW